MLDQRVAVHPVLGELGDAKLARIRYSGSLGVLPREIEHRGRHVEAGHVRGAPKREGDAVPT